MFKGTPEFDRAKGTAVAAVLEAIGARFNATTWFDRTNYYETIPSDELETALRIESSRMRQRAPARRGPRPGDDGRAQRVRARRELALPGALQADVRDGLPRAPVPPPDDRLAQRHRGRCDVAVEGVLRHLLPPEQRDRDAHRRLRGGGRAGLDRAALRRDPAVAEPDPAGLHRGAGAGRRAALHRPPRRAGRLVRALVAHGRGAPRRHAGAGRARQHPRRRHHRAAPPGPRREEPRAVGDGRAVAAARPRALLRLRSRAAGRRALRDRGRRAPGDRARGLGVGHRGRVREGAHADRSRGRLRPRLDRPDRGLPLGGDRRGRLGVVRGLPEGDPRRDARGRAARGARVPPRRRADGRPVPARSRRARRTVPPGDDGESA